jgi:DNA-binding NtrC family response regulator
MTAYSWPGNIRELRNVVERIVLLENTELVEPHQLPPEIGGEYAVAAAGFDIASLFPKPLSAVERAYIEAVLARVGGNKTRAAEILSISRQTLRSKLNGSG